MIKIATAKITFFCIMSKLFIPLHFVKLIKNSKI